MSADFWAGYISGAIGILIGNPLDLIKVHLQARQSAPRLDTAGALSSARYFDTTGSLVRGSAAPVLGYGALNALLFVAYNRSLKALDPNVVDPTNPDGVALYKIWLAGAAGGLASWTVSSPTEFIKCRAQLSRDRSASSWTVTKEIIDRMGWRGLYFGGVVTSIRDSVGYGFYFWSYELCKRRLMTADDTVNETALKILFCGGVAGIATWASVFPLDVIKTRLQAQPLGGSTLDSQPLLQSTTRRQLAGSWEIARRAYREEGLSAFYRGLGVCSIRAFIVNAVQWAAYEGFMKLFNSPVHAKAYEV
ncbi:hypothetical protein VTN49DRAFT_7060 [Thermomyces lanuginosus]|uniref:uncharacterized protein n=1 Tax=Thermomyces lanuginosus TaxID=5541 RepID=UPI003741FE3A